MVRNRLWEAGLLKPSQQYRSKSTDDLACELVNLLARKHKAKQRLKFLLKPSMVVIADEDFNRTHSEAMDDIARATQAATNVKSELKKRGINL